MSSESQCAEVRRATVVAWPRGEAAACKAVYVGSNPIATSSSVLCPPGGRVAEGPSGSGQATYVSLLGDAQDQEGRACSST